MTVEVATYINDLQPVNPTSTDQVSQGDDHLRLIKQVLQNSIIGSSRQWQIPATAFVTSSTTLTRANGESTVFVSTSTGAVSLTLPALAAGDAGWRCFLYKTTGDVNPVFVIPPSGTINSGPYVVARARRCIPGVSSLIVWTGTNWLITRPVSLPIGSLIDYFTSFLPPGFEWPNGQTLASASTNYPEYFAANGSGITPDVRGLACIPLDNLGGVSAGRLPNGLIAQTTLGAVGGVDLSTSTLATSNIPSITSSNASQAISVSGSNVLTSTGVVTSAGGAGSSNTVTLNTLSIGTMTSSGNNSISVTYSNPSPVPFGLNNLQPSIMMGKILVVE